MHVCANCFYLLFLKFFVRTSRNQIVENVSKFMTWKICQYVMRECLVYVQPHLCFTEEVCISEDYECDMHVDMDAVSEEESCDGEEAEEGECDTMTMTDGGADAERYDEKMDFVEEEETLKKIKGK